MIIGIFYLHLKVSWKEREFKIKSRSVIKNAQPAKEIALETGVLRSVVGDGKFLKTEDDY